MMQVPAHAVLSLLAASLISLGASANPTRALQATTTVRPSFEVASVKPSNESARRNGVIRPGWFAQTNITLRELIRTAYGTREIVGGPGWMDSAHFDVDARGDFDLSGFLPGRDGSPPRVYVMLQRLLEDRFGLAVHTATESRPVYALVLARRDGQLGPRLMRSSVDCDALAAATIRAGRRSAPPQPGAMPHCAMRAAPGQLTADSIDMSGLASALSAAVDRAVVDRTALAGRFNVELRWTPDLPALSTNQDANPPTGEAPPVLFTAVQEQLGLKLEPAIAPIQVLVVDRVEPLIVN